MNKPHLILWGGSWIPLENPLTLGNLDSHAKVSFFFLKQALSQYFDLTCIEEFKKIENIPSLLSKETVGILSTFQAGFTALKQKEPEIYAHIKPLLKGKKFSIIDEVPLGKVEEDRLFTVIPSHTSLKGKAKALINNAKIHHMGWCAAPEHCYPEPNDLFTVFIDHGHYAGQDFTDIALQACQSIDAPLKILIQTNKGIESWPKDKLWSNDPYIRSNKIPWREIMSAYRTIDIFCLTHLESAGLSTIEAAMCGASILIPKKDNVPFINPHLIHTNMDTLFLPCEADALKSAIEDKMKTGVRRQENHKRLNKTNAWNVAARNIFNALKNINP